MRPSLEYLVEFEDGCMPEFAGSIAPPQLRSPIFAAKFERDPTE